MGPLSGYKVVTLAQNLPGPAAARRLARLGARVIKVEPPQGDPMFLYSERWYRELNAGQEFLPLDLKVPAEHGRLMAELFDTDLLLTASRPNALERLGLGWEELHQRFPQLCMVGIVGYPVPHENEPGHDLTYQAGIGLLTPPQLPRTLVADMAGGEMAASEALALLLARERGLGSGSSLVALADAAEYMAEPFHYDLTAPGGLLGGMLAEYNIYQAAQGWVAVAALEPHFSKKLAAALDCEFRSPDDLRPLFVQKSAVDWEAWARELDLPIVAVK